jgi:nucleotide-binding universal stress UspA family protein
VGGHLIYVAGSMLAALAQSTTWLIACRIVQGLGVGGLTRGRRHDARRAAPAPAAGGPRRLRQRRPRAARGDAEAEQILRDAVAKVPEDIPVKTLVRRGKPGREIVAQALGCDYDAILLCARGVGRVGALVGSVSSYVMHHADVAVFVAHAPKVREGDQGSTRSAAAAATP